MSEVETTVVLNCHAEDPKWIQRSFMSVVKQISPPDYEILIIADKANPETLKAARECAESVDITGPLKGAKVIEVDYGDLGLSRNHGFRLAQGRYCCTLDMDDLYGCTWLRDAYKYARELREERKSKDLDPDEFVLHQADMIFFGAEQFIHRCVGDDNPEFDSKDLLQWNSFAASCFAPRDTYLKYPYQEMNGGHGYEDQTFHVDTIGKGVSHRVVPDSVYFVRLKRNNTSMAHRYVMENRVTPRNAFFDRRDIPNASKEPDNGAEKSVSPEVHKQALFCHYEVGELQVQLHREMPIRVYPRQRVWNDQAALRDAIGDVEHVVLVRELSTGGAEKFAIDWASSLVANGDRVAIVETEPITSPWLQKAESQGIKVVRWQVQTKDLNASEAAYALRRALIQCDLESVFVCNSPIAWGLIHENAQVLAKKVFAASFAPIPMGHGFSSYPAMYFKGEVAPNLTIVTDNDQHARRMRQFNGLRVEVIPPRVTYSGPSKKSKIDKERMRILWAGRGTPEKRPDLLPSLAAAMEKTADIHVWGDVKPLNAPENLKYRGPFNGFESIDGSYDCYLMTSMYEGCPNTACEAVLADLPVVGPAVGALPDVANRTYKKFNPIEVAQLIEEASISPHVSAKDTVQKWAEKFNGSVKKLVLG